MRGTDWSAQILRSFPAQALCESVVSVRHREILGEMLIIIEATEYRRLRVHRTNFTAPRSHTLPCFERVALFPLGGRKVYLLYNVEVIQVVGDERRKFGTISVRLDYGKLIKPPQLDVTMWR
jgi:hypothetical protein